MQIPFPPSKDGDFPLVRSIEVPAGRSILFIGPNGAGKTRLAGWLDQNTGSKGIYIPARRDLSMPDSYTINSQDKDFEIIYGNTRWGNKVDINHMKAHRFSHEATAFRSDDFQNVLNILASRHVSELQKFHEEYDAKSPPPRKNPTVLQKAIAIWRECLPDLVINTDKAPSFVVERQDQPGKTYEPISMSDGERGLFYLVAKGFLAEPGSLIIVDEPEIHFHRAIRNRFWDLMETARSDCVFAYFTHDIDFATSRSFALRIAIYSFSLLKGQKGIQGEWVYKIVEPDQELPDDLLLAVLGSRTSVLLVEGTRGSLDFVIARAIYPDFMIEPVNSCGDVIRGTTSLNKLPGFHHKTVYGLIDRDFRTDDQATKLAERKIYCHRIREIENILATTAVITAILTNLGRPNESTAAISHLGKVVSQMLKGRRAKFAAELAKSEAKSAIEQAINQSQNSDKDLSTIISEINVQAIDQKSLASIDNAIASGKLDDMLAYVSIRKDDLKSELAKALGLKDWDALKASLDGWLRMKDTEAGSRLLQALKLQLPSIT